MMAHDDREAASDRAIMNVVPVWLAFDALPP
jgi:hypothetical protein